MRSNNGRIDQTDVQVFAESGAVANVFSTGIMPDLRADSVNALVDSGGGTTWNGYGSIGSRAGTTNANARIFYARTSNSTYGMPAELWAETIVRKTWPSNDMFEGIAGEYYTPIIKARWLNSLPMPNDNKPGNPNSVNLIVNVYAANASSEREIITQYVANPGLTLGTLWPQQELTWSRTISKPFPGGEYDRIETEILYSLPVRFGDNQVLNKNFDIIEVWQYDIVRGTESSESSNANWQTMYYLEGTTKRRPFVDYGAGYAGARFGIQVVGGQPRRLYLDTKTGMNNGGVFAFQHWGATSVRVGYAGPPYFNDNSIVWLQSYTSDGYRKYVVPAGVGLPFIEFSRSTTGNVYFDRLGIYPEANTAMDSTDYYRWVGAAPITSSIYDIEVSRTEVDLGVASIALKNAALDPALSGGLRQGMKLWVRLNTKLADADADNWINVFTGRISQVTTSYNKKRKIDIQMTAVDSHSKLATYPFRWGFDTVAELAEPLQWTSVNTIINGTAYNSIGVQAPNDNVVSPSIVDNNMTAIDAVLLARNTEQGLAYVNKDDQLVVHKEQYGNGPETITLSDLAPANIGTDPWIPYAVNGIDIGFDTSRVINQVKITNKKGTEDTTYTFTNKESYELRGPASVSIEVVNRTEQQCIALATAILNTYETPSLTATYVSFPVKTRQHLQQVANIDLLDRARVVYTGKLDKLMRIREINMRITPGRMSVRYGFTSKSDSAIWLT